MQRIGIGTRSSMLAISQGRLVADALGRLAPAVRTELVPFVARGDRVRGPLARLGGKGLFTAELNDALRSGDIHLAVHSAKDVPTDVDDGLVIAAVPVRADAADALVSADGGGIEALPAGARVATGSGRRRAQLLAVRPDLAVVPIRGNVETRLAKVLDDAGDERFDATVLAMAGLGRSGLLAAHSGCVCRLEPADFIPAAGQGALIVQCLAGSEAAEIVAGLNDSDSFQAVTAERSVLADLGAGCHSAIAVHVFRDGDLWRARAMAARSDGGGMIRAEARAADSQSAAVTLGDELRRAGAAELLAG